MNHIISSGLEKGKEPEKNFALVWLSYSVHGNESSSTEAAMETLFSFANTSNKKIIDWLKIALGLAPDFQGVIQDSATSATLSAVLTMRERSLDWNGNKKGLFNQKRLRIYVSTEAHISIDRAIWFSGIGEENLIKIPVEGKLRSMNTNLLIEKINTDKKAVFITSTIPTISFPIFE